MGEPGERWPSKIPQQVRYPQKQKNNTFGVTNASIHSQDQDSEMWNVSSKPANRQG